VDFVEWSVIVLNKSIEANRLETISNELGAHYWQLATLLFGKEVAAQDTFQATTYCKAMEDASRTLQMTGLQMSGKVTKAGRDHAKNPLLLWWEICQEQLDPEYAQLLRIVNRLSPRAASDHVWLEWIDYQTLVTALGWGQNTHLIRSVAIDLMEWGLVYTMQKPAAQEVSLRASYPGLVWETRRGLTLESKLIDDLVADWETTSVEFKSDLYTDTASQKAECIKDILSLATTKASGRRWMIIGFDDDTHDYCGSPNPKLTQNHFEQLLQEYTKPIVKVRYQVVDYRRGPVGKLEVFRDAKDIPYKVAKSLGSQSDKRRITEGDIYVRHGSQVQIPTPEELHALQEEGDQARLNL